MPVNKSSSLVSIYILLAVILGVVAGLVFGALFDSLIPWRRILAVLAGLVAIGVDYLVRRFFGKSYPQLFLDTQAGIPASLMLAACVIALAGGLATHDLALVFGFMSGPALGGFSGLFANLMKAVLVVLRETEHRDSVAAAVPPKRSPSSSRR